MSTHPLSNTETVNLDVIKAPAVVSAKKTESYDREIRELEKDRNRLRNLELKQKIGARRVYVFAIFAMVSLWIAGIYALLILQGFQFYRFHLSDGIVLAAIGSTTANVLAL